jgi:hypothetical protein
MTCAEARPWLSLRQPLPLEAGAGLLAHVAEHVQNCPACAAWTSRVAAFDTAVGKTMREVPVPCGLKARLLHQAENERRARSRQRLFRVAMPLAACLLLAILGWSFRDVWQQNRPVDLVALQHRMELWERQPVDQRIPLTPGEARQHLPKEIKERWNLNNLRSAYQTSYQGKTVAVLEFQSGSARAMVVLLPPEQVDPAQMQQYFPDRYGTSPRILGDPGKGEYVALVVIRSGQYKDFLKPTHLPSGA